MSYQTKDASANSVDDLLRYVLDEFNKIEQAFNLFDLIRLKTVTVSPPRPRDGMVVYASAQDGEWEPVESGGAGFYGYYGGSWHKLG